MADNRVTLTSPQFAAIVSLIPTNKPITFQGKIVKKLIVHGETIWQYDENAQSEEKKVRDILTDLVNIIENTTRYKDIKTSEAFKRAKEESWF